MPEYPGHKTAADKGPIRIDPIEHAPPRCTALREYFSLESRMTINRILRGYFERVTITPTELLHSAKEFGRLRDKDSLFPSAVDRIATLQTQGTEQPSRARRDEIFTAADQVYAQARRADSLKLPRLEGRFSAVIAGLSGGGGDPPEYLAMVVLSRDLLTMRDWVAKLDRLCRLAVDETDARATLLLDTVIADVLGANVVQELLGGLPSLASAIIALLDLADGKFDSTKSEIRDVADQLNGLFAEGRLPGSRHVMVDRALRQLRSPSPLSRNRPDREMEEYQRVLARLMGPGGLLAGAEAAEAITVRGGRFVEEGGATGRRAAIAKTVHALPDAAHGVMYLAELSKCGFAGQHLDDIVKQLDMVFSARVITQLTQQALSPKDRLVTATSAFNATQSSALPPEVKQRVTTHIDGVLLRYLVEEQVIERLDNPSDPLRIRAVRLVKFIGAGVLPDGKALAKARDRIVHLLRQPDFDGRFIEGIRDPAQAQQALRDFHTLLVQAGFGR